MRLEFETDALKLQDGDGGPTIDVCMRCNVRHQLDVGVRLPKFQYDGIEINYAETTGIEVEHPPYADDDYRCDLCGQKLTDAD